MSLGDIDDRPPSPHQILDRSFRTSSQWMGVTAQFATHNHRTALDAVVRSAPGGASTLNVGVDAERRQWRKSLSQTNKTSAPRMTRTRKPRHDGALVIRPFGTNMASQKILASQDETKHWQRPLPLPHDADTLPWRGWQEVESP
jgi:hypothetical protein